jgi:type I restriction enzyme M protein
MLTGSIRSQIDAIWQGGGFNPLSVIEQFTYLLFAKGLNDVHTR